MNIKKIVYSHNLRTPDSVTVICGENKKVFPYSEAKNVGKWLMEIWEKEEEEHFGLFFSEAKVYYNIDWDCDNVLYCKYIVA